MFIKAYYKGYPIEILVDEQDLNFVVKPHLMKQKNNKLRIDVVYKGHREYLHRVVLGVTGQKVIVDHINGDPLANRRINLRLATDSQNVCNKTKSRNNTSGYKGVWKRNDGRRKCWVAEIVHNGIDIKIGSFYTKEDAAKAYNTFAIKFHKEFANLNKVA